MVVLCEVCGKQFTKITTLHLHQKTIHSTIEEKLHRCHICDKAFLYPHSVAVHVNEVHSNKSYLCPHCGITCTKDRSLKVHIQRKHTDTKIYECEMCMETFLSKLCLKAHRDEANHLYTCELCEEKFQSKPGLKAHHDTKHLGKRFSCEQCIKSYTSKQCLRKHVLREHTATDPMYKQKLLDGKQLLSFIEEHQLPMSFMLDDDLKNIALYQHYIGQKNDVPLEFNKPIV